MRGEFRCKEDVLCGVKEPKEINNLTVVEKEHAPIITSPAKVGRGDYFEVGVEVGHSQMYLGENMHFIEWIELYAGDTYVAKS